MACYLADDDQLPGEWVDGEWFLGVESSHRVGHPSVVAVVGVSRVHSTDHSPDRPVLASPELVPRRVEPINQSINHTQPFTALLDFIRDCLGELAPER